MTNSEINKLTVIIFHLAAFIFLFISFALMLDFIFSRSVDETINEGKYFEINSTTMFSISAVLIGSISWLILILKWIKKGEMEFYLKSIFFAKSVLIIGVISLLLV